MHHIDVSGVTHPHDSHSEGWAGLLDNRMSAHNGECCFYVRTLRGGTENRTIVHTALRYYADATYRSADALTLRLFFGYHRGFRTILETFRLPILCHCWGHGVALTVSPQKGGCAALWTGYGVRGTGYSLLVQKEKAPLPAPAASVLFHTPESQKRYCIDAIRSRKDRFDARSIGGHDGRGSSLCPNTLFWAF